MAPRGVTQWVRNLCAAGGGELALGRTVEPFDAVELADDQKLDVLRAYLRRWKFEVAAFFEGVSTDSAEEVLRRVAPQHPVFRVDAR